MYLLEFDEGWEKYFRKLDKSVKQKIIKKIKKLKTGLSARHLKHGLAYFVVETGQYRICFKTDEKRKVRRIYFAGTHKDYKRWIKEQ
ncbi:MAG: hypothetical protein J7K68_02345 [Candidatus Diapherotrites archaeon]|nr:hypothetical protein [Candidatus Diapherotrites archaeon]